MQTCREKLPLGSVKNDSDPSGVAASSKKHFVRQQKVKLLTGKGGEGAERGGNLFKRQITPPKKVNALNMEMN